MLTAIVTTTINPPDFLEAYIQNFAKFEVNPNEVVFIVVGDNKTPLEYEYVSRTDGSLYERLGVLYPIEYWSPKAQNLWIKRTLSQDSEEIKRLIIPHDDPRRRNFGFLRAHELGADVIITIDDDNLPLPNSDWLGEHIMGLENPYSRLGVSSPNGIVNPCRLLQLNEHFIYSRGYPISEFLSDEDTIICTMEDKRTMEDKKESILNMGLWTLKPDVDSFTNLVYPDLHSFGQKFPFKYLGVNMDTYFPINTQNTAFKKKLSIFHNLYMDPSFIHRYDDIWMGLFAQKLAHKMGDVTSFGLPLVMHKRNTHDYQKDLSTEFLGIAMNSKMWSEVRNMDISSKNYIDGFLEIADKLPIFRDSEVKKFLGTMKESMRLWVELVDEIT